MTGHGPYNLIFFYNYHVDFSMAISGIMASNFISFLHINGYAVSTIITYISALGFHHKILGLADPMSPFVVRTQLKALGKQAKSDSRLPITKPVIAADCYKSVLLKAMFALAFKACLRISEFSAPTSMSSHTLLLSDIQVLTNSVVINFSTFKHSKGPAQVIVRDEPFVDGSLVSFLQSYL